MKSILTLFLLLAVNYSFAQCDSIKLSRFSVDAFSDSAFAFDVDYTGNIHYNYPNYKAVNNFGDTLAQSKVFTFILTSGYREKLTITQGTTMPLNFLGKILVYSDFEDSLQCVLNVDEDLCSFSDSCNLVAISMDNFGGAMVNGSFNFRVLDNQNNNLHSGQFVLSNTSQSSTDLVCLPSGKYTLEIDSSEYLGGQIFINTKTLPEEFYNISHQYLYKKTIIDLEIFPLCKAESNRIIESEVKEIDFYFSNGYLNLNTPLEITQINIFSLQGSLVSTDEFPSFPLKIKELKPGVYLLQVMNNSRQIVQKIFFD